MYVRCNPNRKNVKYLSYVKGFRDESGKAKQVTVKKIGDWVDLIKLYDDPIKHFNDLAKSEKDDITFSVYSNETLSPSSSRKNLGYFALKKIYNELDLKSLFDSYSRKIKMQYDLNDIFQLLTYSRILYPGSKKETYENKDFFFEKFDFSLKDIYRSLDHLPSLKNSIEDSLWNNTKDIYHRDCSTLYYDCTNYYFEVSYNDEDLVDEEGNVLEKGYRKKGPSKEHRPEPIIGMGLLMDNNGIPLSYDLFPGNESEKDKLRPHLKKAKTKFDGQRTIIVADRGLNTSDNMYFISGKNYDESNNDGYLYGQSILGADKEFKDWVLENNYHTDNINSKDGNIISWKHKSRIFGKTIQIKRDDKRNTKVVIYQKQMVYYSPKYAIRQKKQREQVLTKARDLIRHPSKYNKASSHGIMAYIKNINFDKNTGEVIDKDLSLDELKINEQAKFDGYYCIVTSEKEMSDITMRNTYKGLWEIEETFKISKSYIHTRPIYVWTKEHIEAHFLTCFVSLVIIRLLEKKLGEKYSTQHIINSLKKFSCSNIKGNYYLFDYNDDILNSLESLFSISLRDKFRTLSNIKNILK